MTNSFRIRKISCMWMVSILILMAGSIDAKKEELSPTPPPTATPLVGESLESAIRESADRKSALIGELRELDRQIDELSSRKARARTCIVRDILRESAMAQLGFIGLIAWICLWVFLLMVMYGRMRGDAGASRRKMARWLFIGFLVLGALCIVSGIADAAGQTLELPQTELPGTLDRIQEYETLHEWEQVLIALEGRNCYEIGISEDVRTWLKANSPEGIEISPVITTDPGQPDRLTTIAAVYWASGNKEKALKILAPMLDASFNPYSETDWAAFMNALRMFTAAMDEAGATKIADKMQRSMSPVELVNLARILRKCAYNQAIDYMDRAKKRTRTPEDVLAVADALKKEFSKPEDSIQFLRANLDMTVRFDAMTLFLAHARTNGLTDLEQEIISRNIELRKRPSELMELAGNLLSLDYINASERAVGKALENEQSRSGLVAIAQQSLQWQFPELAEMTLQTIIDQYGIDGSIMPFPDPHILNVPFLGNIPDPNVGIVRAVMAEKRGDLEKARLYYTEMLNFELSNALACQGFPFRVNFANFIYPYRFFVSQGDTHLVDGLDPIGRQLEKALIATVDASEIRALESDIALAKDRIGMLQKDISRLRVRQAVDWIFRFFFFVFMVGFAVVLITAQVVIIRRTIVHVKRLDHLRVFGAVMKFQELEAFVFVASVVFAPAALLVIVYTQVLQAVLFTESHLFRLSEHRRKGKTDEFPKLPLTYRDRE